MISTLFGYRTHLHKHYPLVMLQWARIAKCLYKISTSSLLGHSYCTWWRQGNTVATKNCHCHGPIGGGLERQGKVHERIKCDRDFVANWTYQSRLVLSL